MMDKTPSKAIFSYIILMETREEEEKQMDADVLWGTACSSQIRSLVAELRRRAFQLVAAMNAFLISSSPSLCQLPITIRPQTSLSIDSE